MITHAFRTQRRQTGSVKENRKTASDCFNKHDQTIYV